MRYLTILTVISFQLLVLGEAGWAGVRVSNVGSARFINPDASGKIADMFLPSPGAMWRIGGGVFMDGSATFFVEEGGDTTPVPASAVGIAFDDGSAFLVHDNERYKVEVHAGLSCPLSRFILRGGLLAYTIPPEQNEEAERRLIEVGIVDNEIAKEFVGSGFEDLLYRADFANTESLHVDLVARIKRAVSDAAGLDQAVSTLESFDSYINSDQQVTYQVLLVHETHTVDVAGVPLRYYWAYDQSGSAPLITRIEIWSTEFDMEELATDTNSYFGQYDAVVLYQTAGIYSEINRTNPTMFEKFSEDSCGNVVH